MAMICYVCNQETALWCQNFTAIESQHTKMLISELIRRFLGDFQSLRNIDDESNCICWQCLDRVNEWDLAYKTADIKYKTLQSLLLSTEISERDKINPIEFKTESTEFHSASEAVENIEPIGDIVKNETLETPEATETPETTTQAQPELKKHILVRHGEKLMKVRLTNEQISNGTMIKFNGKVFRIQKKRSSVSKTQDSITKTKSPVVREVCSQNVVNQNVGVGSKSDLKTKPMRNRHKLINTIKRRSETDTNAMLLNGTLVVKKSRMECSICGEEFNYLKKYKAHRKWHERNPGFICKMCSAIFNDSNELKDHVKLHSEQSPDEPFRCLVCEKLFTDARKLRTHCENHHGRRDKICDLCGKAFITMFRLREHMNVHTKQLQYPCPICDKKLSDRSNMKLHLKVHSDDRPHSCSFCDMKFKRSDHCRVHERRHREETKTEKCTLCTASFEHIFHLKQHMNRKHKVIPISTLTSSDS